LPFRGVEVGITAVRRRDNRLRFWQKREAVERKYDQKQCSCFFELNQWIHGSFLSFPRWVDSAIAGSGKRRRTQRGKSSRLIQDLRDAEFGRNLANLSNQNAASADRRFQFDTTQSAFIRAHNETLSVVAMRICNPDCSTLAIELKPQAKLQPTFLETDGDDFLIFRAHASTAAAGLRAFWRPPA
jgi:hypothetical protein